ncbi:MAG: hypothetical protein KBE38_07120 [Ignavibacterium sp.]|nr:hypothetical protein [Ignavibacterium sp.]
MKYTLTIILVLISVALSYTQETEKAKPNYDIFSFEKEVTLPGTLEQIFDAATGDISGWWDHSFSGNPKKFYIEAKPGGGFWEIFDDEGNGVLHATVIYSKRPEMIRFDGPLGLSGRAVQIVTTYEFSEVMKDSTLMKISVHGSGEMEEGMTKIVEQVWEHFIFERFKPYIEERKHLK